MKKLLLLLVCMISCSGLCAQVSNNNEDEVYKMASSTRGHAAMDFVAGEVLVKMKDASPVAVRRVAGRFKQSGNNELDAVLREFGVSQMEQVLPGEKRRTSLRRAKAPNGGIIEECDLSQLYRVRMEQPDMMKTRQLAERLEALSDVEYAEPNYRAYIMGEVDHGETIANNPAQNPSYTLQWGIPAMKIKELWTKPVVNSKRPVIAIIDTGVDTTHPDLKDNCIAGYDFINETDEMRDNNGHGTHVAGIAAACDNNIGIIGANPRALIMPVAVMQSDGTGDMATIIRGIDYAAQNGADVINMSLGSYSNSKALRDALARAYQTCVIVAAAGNDGHSIYSLPHPLGHCKVCSPAFPAAYSFVLGVQATQQDDSLASFSNYDPDGPNYSEASDPYGDEGLNYELKAPGVSILSTVPNGGYRQYNGTSMAAPLVAGAVSALKMVKQYDSQEVLWGDLLHTSDFLAAYNLTDRPAELEVLGLQYGNRQELVNGENHTESDGRIDAGETIMLYPVLRSVFGEAKNIKLHLEVSEFEDASIVTIMQNDVDFGYNLSAYGKAVSVNPIIFKTKGNVTGGRLINLKLIATCGNTDQAMEHEFVITVNNMTKIGGMITKDMTLVASKKYLVNSSLVVPEEVTLTIEPGTVITFVDGTGIKSEGKLIAVGTPENPIVFTGQTIPVSRWTNTFVGIDSQDTIKYAIYENVNPGYTESLTILENCRVRNYTHYLKNLECYNCNLENLVDVVGGFEERNYNEIHGVYSKSKNNNIVNSIWWVNSDKGYLFLPVWRDLNNSNYFNNYCKLDDETWEYSLICTSSNVAIEKSDYPSYLGTSKETIARKHIYEFGNSVDGFYGTYGTVDLSNMLTEPVHEAHGIVWKILVNSKDAQDEYEDMLPLGVGRHKFEVYYNRPMNKEVIPNIAFGVREPYTQNAVNEDGAWNEDGTIYTAYVTITKRTQSDGVNRIYVWGGEDDEFFECPYEKTRFNVNIQAASSMSTGFMAEGGAGCVNLSWNKSGADDIDDAMGYNIYRYTERVRYEDVLDEFGNKVWDDEADDWMKREIIERDTLRINPYVIDVDQESYVDRAVTPGETYYYYYKLQGTNMKEYGISNTVSAIPMGDDLTALVGVSQEAWHAGGMVGWAAPQVTTRDGRETALAERYAETTEVTGTVLEQTVTGLSVGVYEVTLFANAFYTPDRGFDSDITEGQTDVVYLFANDTEQYIPVHIGTSVTEHGEYTLVCDVTDGTLHLGMVAAREGTNWHSIQIKSLDRTGDLIIDEDLTARVGISADDWHTNGMVGWAGPEVTTRDGRTTALAERYVETTAVTGTVLEQTVTGLPVGAYEVTLFANAFYTPDRGFDSDIAEGQTDVVYLFANETKKYIPAHIGTSVAEHGEYTLACNVTDGSLHLGMTAAREGTNWHSIQIKSLDRTGNVKTGKKGDVNGDGAADVADIASVISVMAGSIAIAYSAADVNGDGSVDVADIATIISIMAGQ